MKRAVYFISDGTGITVEQLGRSLLTQFDPMLIETKTVPYIDTPDKAKVLIDRIKQTHPNNPPVLFTSLVDANIRVIFQTAGLAWFDLFDTFLGNLEQALGQTSAHQVGRQHGDITSSAYHSRIEAVNFALLCDDGNGCKHYANAEVILIGASRSGKTPTSLYLALQFGILAANYPLTEEDMDSPHLPKPLQPFQSKLFGLTLDPQRLHEIRRERRANSQYAQLAQCRAEQRFIHQLYHQYQLPNLDATKLSIEEISTKILAKRGIGRHY